MLSPIGRNVQYCAALFEVSICNIAAITKIIKTKNGFSFSLLYKNSSEDEIANVNFLRRYGTYVLQNTKKENLLRLTN